MAPGDSASDAGPVGPSDKQTSASAPLRQAPGLVVLVALLVFAQHARADGWASLASVVLGLATVASLVWLWRRRRGFLANVASVPFAAGLLAFLALATALGTFVPQGEAPAPPDSHGSFGTHLGGFLFLGDLFHSLWFGGLLALLAFSLILAVLRKPFWRPYYWGFALAHGGMVVLLAGATVGRWWGEAGMLNLHAGAKEVNEFELQRRGVPSGQRRALDFALKLNAFDVEKYPRKEPCRLAVYRQVEGEEHCPVVYAASLAEARRGFTVPATGVRIQLREFYPDAEITETMEETADAEWPPAVQVRLRTGSPQEQHWVAAGSAPHAAEYSPGLEIEWGELGGAAGDAWTARTLQGRPAVHRVGLPGGAEMEVRAGETYTPPGVKGRFKVLAFYPHFSYDIEKHQASSVSDEPRNPALEIEVYEEAGTSYAAKTQYLFPGQAGHMDKGNPLGLTYRYEPPVRQAERLIRVDGKTHQFAYATAGREVLRRAFVVGQPQELDLGAGAPPDRRTVVLEVTEALTHARPRREAKSLSEKLGHSAALVNVEREGHPEAGGEALLDLQDSSWLDLGDDLVLVLEKREEEIKAFRSHVTVMRGGQPVEDAVIAVNDPLSLGGYTFYQSDYRPSDPTFSGLKVVKDPGLIFVYLGMMLVSLGVTYTLYVRPRLRRGGVPEENAA